ncbi:hypothetical protein GGR51DRAFT_538551 [Nemania sp. FL0031]|nr:hypothetical protein GGR51DRAFT_538551 [Nemania sp. FL0031]
MASLFFRARAITEPTDDQMKQSRTSDNSASTGPSPSLWPEPAHPVACAARQVQFKTGTSEIPKDACRPVEGASCTQQGTAQTECAVSHETCTTAGTASSTSTIPSSYSTDNNITSSSTNNNNNITSSSSANNNVMSSSSRPIDTEVPDVFEPRYPRWQSFPPIHPTEFDLARSSNPMFLPLTMKDDSLLEDITYNYLRQSAAFQDWMNKINAQRIALRHGPAYEELVSRLHKFQFLANHGRSPAARANAKHYIPEIERSMAREREKISAAELQCIRHIERGWVSFVNIEKYEEVASRQRVMSERAREGSNRPLSKVECLLGSDGSTFDTVALTQACSTMSQPTHYGAPYKVHVPDWFYVVDVQRSIQVFGHTIEDRFKYLLREIAELERLKEHYEYKKKHPNETVTQKDETWEKHWHDPNPGWPHAHHRRHGGWWKCRKGPRATVAENNCIFCVEPDIPEPPSPARRFDDIMRRIENAMAIVARNDENLVLKRINHENRKPIKVGDSSQWHADEYWKEWEFQRGNPGTTAVPQATPFSTLQPYINPNTLTSNRGPRGTRASSQAKTQQTAPKNEAQQTSHNASKSKADSKSNRQTY